MTYDIEEWSLYGIHYKATRKQANDLYMELLATVDVTGFDALQCRVNYGRFDATSDEGRTLCEELASWRAKIECVVMRLVRSHGYDG